MTKEIVEVGETEMVMIDPVTEEVSYEYYTSSGGSPTYKTH